MQHAGVLAVCAAASSLRYNRHVETSVAITINGERREAPQGATVADLLRQLNLPTGRVAIERNLEILPRPQWNETTVQSGDRYEIVHFVGGG
ncbi:MAG: sulfur carrier protein ThiS [Acidobacteriota bacterium]|nr:sulfur carrier protein ThiS [Acidobacteriota bacterium]